MLWKMRMGGEGGMRGGCLGWCRGGAVCFFPGREWGVWSGEIFAVDFNTSAQLRLRIG